jgi:hypothetical protein
VLLLNVGTAVVMHGLPTSQSMQSLDSHLISNTNLTESCVVLLLFHAAQGVRSGIATAAAGVASGVVGLFAAPIVGAKQEGASGFAKGLATGECQVPAMRRPPVFGECGTTTCCSWQLCVLVFIQVLQIVVPLS